MASDFDISSTLKNLRNRQSIGRIGPSSPGPSAQELKKTMGDPAPKKANINDYPEKLREPFKYRGILSTIARKLNAITGEKYVLQPAEGHRVCINEKGVVFVGMLFVEENLSNEPVLAAVLCHEWGHFPNHRKDPANINAMPWEEIYKLRRAEETKADMFCGRALFRLRYPFKPFIEYLKRYDNPKDKSQKYHTVRSRARIISESYYSEAKRNFMASNLKLSDAVYGDPVHGSRIIGA